MGKNRDISTVLQRDLVVGGVTGQVLVKASGADYDVAWANSVISFNNLIGEVNVTTTLIPEGANLYYTNARVRAAVGTAAANAKGISYVENTGEFSLADSGVTAGTYGNASLIPKFTVDRFGRITDAANIVSAGGGGGGGVVSVNGLDGAVTLTTTQIPEGSNLYYTNARVWSNITMSLFGFSTVSANGQSVVADSWNDTLTLEPGDGITIVGTTANDTVNFAVAPNLVNRTLTNVTVVGSIDEQVYTLTDSVLNPKRGTIQSRTLSGTTTFTDSFTSGESMILMLYGGDVYTVNWPGVSWVSTSGNVAPTLAANSVVVLWKVGTPLFAAYAGSFTT